MSNKFSFHRYSSISKFRHSTVKVEITQNKNFFQQTSFKDSNNMMVGKISEKTL